LRIYIQKEHSKGMLLPLYIKYFATVVRPHTFL